MRRVYDDSMYIVVSSDIMANLRYLSKNKKLVQEYSWGMMRSSLKKIQQYIKDALPNIKFGRNVNTTGIGNNAAYEIILATEEEEQIVGILHLTDDMFGSHICWMSDIDNERQTESIKV